MRVCSSCGGSNVSELQWRDINDGSLIEGTTETKCWDCADLVTVVDASAYQRDEAACAADFARDSARDSFGDDLVSELRHILDGSR